jgi:hypothetical protein
MIGPKRKTVAWLFALAFFVCVGGAISAALRELLGL